MCELKGLIDYHLFKQMFKLRQHQVTFKCQWPFLEPEHSQNYYHVPLWFGFLRAAFQFAGQTRQSCELLWSDLSLTFSNNLACLHVWLDTYTFVELWRSFTDLQICTAIFRITSALHYTADHGYCFCKLLQPMLVLRRPPLQMKLKLVLYQLNHILHQIIS